MEYTIIALPNGVHCVTHQEPRAGFTVPQGVLDGSFTSREEAEQYIYELTHELPTLR